uniref:Uncharacterized protein n=1 Tax=Arundo donax TaxID=35708 RepID=A0A0A9JQ08_ARUDO
MCISWIPLISRFRSACNNIHQTITPLHGVCGLEVGIDPTMTLKHSCQKRHDRYNIAKQLSVI